MKTAHAILVASVVGTVGIVLAERRGSRGHALHAADTHQRLMSEFASDSEYLAQWEIDGLSNEEKAIVVRCNQLISHLLVRYRVGLLDRAGLRAEARALMDRVPYRNYWARFGARRGETAVDRVDRSFNAIFDTELTAAAEDAEAVAA
ncbi:DUF6082 family protein [Streptomyces sp. NPDC050095]|uniref:DUF6082 family protein n=1 Tax=unclassified Streptomyces TaxID=2593676 RepID=UPI00344147E3